VLYQAEPHSDWQTGLYNRDFGPASRRESGGPV